MGSRWTRTLLKSCPRCCRMFASIFGSSLEPVLPSEINRLRSAVASIADTSIAWPGKVSRNRPRPRLSAPPSVPEVRTAASATLRIMEPGVTRAGIAAASAEVARPANAATGRAMIGPARMRGMLSRRGAMPTRRSSVPDTRPHPLRAVSPTNEPTRPITLAAGAPILRATAPARPTVLRTTRPTAPRVRLTRPMTGLATLPIARVTRPACRSTKSPVRPENRPAAPPTARATPPTAPSARRA